MKIDIFKVNAFTENLDGGNPAGVVFDSPQLSPSQMAYISKKLNVSETAFFFPSKKANYKVLYYTPTVEVELCGHATIASFFTMGLEKIVKDDSIINIETKAGILPIYLFFSKGKIEKVMMTQAKNILKDISLNISKISNSLRINKEDVNNSLPNQLTSSGLFTLPICVKSFDILKSIKPDYSKVTEICKKYNAGSFFVFTFDTIEEKSTYHARCFCPLYGVNEDPTTGTANGAVCSYLKKNNIIKGKDFYCEQGDIIGRPGRVYVNIDNDTIKVGGKAKIVNKEKIEI